MIEVLLFVCAACVLVFGSASLVLAALALRAARRYVDLAEERLELLRRGQARLLAPSAGGRRVPEGGATFEREIEELRQARRGISLPAAAGPSEARRPEGGGRKAGATPTTEFPETSMSHKRPAASKKPASDGPLGDARPRLGVRHPHPDDSADLPARAPSGPARAHGGVPAEMFRKHYDKYLENYRGYVELAERLYRKSSDAGTRPDSSEEGDREERLRRVNDGIARTIARLDILEGLNPELAGDDRVARRASVARRHAELAGGGGAAGRS